MVLRYLTEHGDVMKKQLVEVTGFSQAKTIRVLNALITKSAIKKLDWERTRITLFIRQEQYVSYQ